MIIIPAVDIRKGKCVRLLQGRQDAETIFSDDPAAMALKWEKSGAELIHIVDLDGAFSQKPCNLETIRLILKTISVPVQLGGGIRNLDTIKMYLKMGVTKVILGTQAIQSPELIQNAGRTFPGQIIVGIDARDGMVAIDGWTATTRIRPLDLAQRFENCNLAAINFTDIHRDGMQTGPNLEATRQLAEAISIPVVASGGVSCLNDIKALLPLESAGVTGIITGRALYSGTLNLEEAIRITHE